MVNINSLFSDSLLNIITKTNLQKEKQKNGGVQCVLWMFECDCRPFQFGDVGFSLVSTLYAQPSAQEIS